MKSDDHLPEGVLARTWLEDCPVATTNVVQINVTKGNKHLLKIGLVLVPMKKFEPPSETLESADIEES